MNKKTIFTIALSIALSILAMCGFSQVVSEPYRLFPKANFRPPTDTSLSPIFIGEIRYRPADAKFYKSISLSGQKWAELIPPSSGGTPGGSNGQVQFNNSGAFGGSSNLFWDNSNSRLGIGTNIPSSILHAVAGVTDIRFSQGQLNQTPSIAVINTDAGGRAAGLASGTAGSVFAYDDGGVFAIMSESKSSFLNNSIGSGSIRMTVHPNGNIGINTGLTDAGYKFDVNGTTRLLSASGSGDAVYVQGGSRSINVFNSAANGNAIYANLSATSGFNDAIVGISGGSGASENRGVYGNAFGASVNYGGYFAGSQYGSYSRGLGTSGTVYGVYGIANGSGASVNHGGFFTASGATTNYALYTANGSVVHESLRSQGARNVRADALGRLYISDTAQAASAAWGSITGTLSSQTDLQSALDGKANSSHTHSIANVTGLQAALDGKQETLVSGSNIKTVNGQSILGAGDISAGATINNNINDNLVTASGTANTLNGESALTFNGTTLNVNTTGSLDLPDGTTAQRPSISNGNIRFNSDSRTIEVGDGLRWSSIGAQADRSRKTRGYYYHNEFMNTVGTTNDGTIVATNSGAGAASTAQATDAVNRPGLIRASTGTTATGRTSVSSGLSAMRIGGGVVVYETSLNITTLSNSTERYQLIVGLMDATTAANQTDGAFFLYDEGGVSTGSTAATYWQTATASNGARSFNTSLTQTTVNQAAWVNLRIEVNADATSVSFFINNNLVATHTGTIPTGPGRELGFGYLLIKSVGTTARTVDFDFISIEQEFTTAR